VKIEVTTAMEIRIPSFRNEKAIFVFHPFHIYGKVGPIARPPSLLDKRGLKKRFSS
jgi:hypothetical protein